jgi:hypothetical protein
MAKSKSGGTRSYLRGRIASDVYSIGRDSNGKKQQVVRSLAEQVKNPQTTAQMRGRMIMSTVMQAVAAMAPIIDHSFDNVPSGQPSISEFIRRNYTLIKADVAAHAARQNTFGLNKYQEKGAKAGAYVVSGGDAILPSAFIAPQRGDSGCGFTIPETATTAGAIRTAIGISGEDYITIVGIKEDGTFGFYRISISSALADETVITKDNLAQFFSIDNPLGFSITFDMISGELQILSSAFAPSAVGAIFTKKVSAGFSHSTCVLDVIANPAFNADVALPTYPEGTERFLNGGEL